MNKNTIATRSNVSLIVFLFNSNGFKTHFKNVNVAYPWGGLKKDNQVDFISITGYCIYIDQVTKVMIFSIETKKILFK